MVAVEISLISVQLHQIVVKHRQDRQTIEL